MRKSWRNMEGNRSSVSDPLKRAKGLMTDFLKEIDSQYRKRRYLEFWANRAATRQLLRFHFFGSPALFPAASREDDFLGRNLSNLV